MLITLVSAMPGRMHRADASLAGQLGTTERMLVGFCSLERIILPWTRQDAPFSSAQRVGARGFRLMWIRSTRAPSPDLRSNLS